MTVDQLLKKCFPSELVDELLKAYQEIEKNFMLGKWKESELDSGHFVETARRIVEAVLQSGKYTPLSQQLPKLNQSTLMQYEQGSGDESYRILIPRILYGIYGIRNKRGVGHVGSVSPNRMDATLIVYDVKWVLAELVRLCSGLPADKTQRIVDEIVEREVELLWKHEDVTSVAVPSLAAAEQVLVLLYDTSPQKGEELQESVEYKNSTNFKKILKRLHDKKLLYWRKDDDRCIIMPAGLKAAERILKKPR